jgi:hypothetical protein
MVLQQHMSMPYVIAAAVGLVLLVLFPIPGLLALCAWGLWAGRGYDRVLALLGLATVVVADEQRMTAVIWLTLGLGIPLMFVGTAFAYGLCARPAVRAWSGPPSWRVPAIALSAVAVVALAVLPGLIGRMQAYSGVRTLRAKDHVPAKPPALQSLEIRRPASSYDGTFEDNNACGPECRSVLAAGRVGWVRVAMLGSTDSSTVYRRAGAAECGGGPKLDLPKSCVLVADDPGGVADLVIAFDKVAESKTDKGIFVTWHPARSVVATRREGGKGVEILRQTGAVVEIPSIPAFILMMRFAQLTDTSHAISLRRTLVTLGLIPAGKLAEPAAKLADATPPRRRTWEDGIDAGMNREVEAVLNLSQVGAFSADQSRVITDWLSAARQIKTWAPDQLALLRRIALDRRIKVPTDLHQIFERRREVAEALLPDILGLLEAHGVTNDFTTERQAAYTFARIDPDLLAPHARRILALLKKDSELQGILLLAVGRLGVDPSSYLLPIARDMEGVRYRYGSPYPRVRGACFAETRWAPMLIPGLRDALSANARMQKPDSSFEEAALKALAKQGDAEFVRQYLAPRDDADAKRLAQRIDQELKRPRGRDSLCWN